jgi:hypothetical protein
MDPLALGAPQGSSPKVYWAETLLVLISVQPI